MTESDYWDKLHEMDAEFHAKRMKAQDTVVEANIQHIAERKLSAENFDRINHLILQHRIKTEGVEQD